MLNFKNHILQAALDLLAPRFALWSGPIDAAAASRSISAQRDAAEAVTKQWARLVLIQLKPNS